MDAVPSYLTAIAAIVLLSGFVKIASALSILRYGIGLQGSGFGIVIIVLSLSLGLLTIPLQLPDPVTAFLSGTLTVTPQALDQSARPFLEKHSDPKTLTQLTILDRKMTSADATAPARFSVVVCSYLLTQLKQAFELGLLFIIPFLVIDLLVVNVLLALGVTQIPAAVVAFPMKILLFVGLNGWDLVSQKLLNGYL